MQIMVNNESDSTITLTLPLTGCINFNGNSITLTSGAWAKINIISDGTNLFLSHSVFGTGNGW